MQAVNRVSDVLRQSNLTTNITTISLADIVSVEGEISFVPRTVYYTPLSKVFKAWKLPEQWTLIWKPTPEFAL